MARYRRGSVFVRDPREHSTPLDRNQKVRILYLAEALERSTKGKGRRNGALGYVGLRVLKALLLSFHNRKTGLCCPGYDALQRVTGLCRQSIASGLRRLEAAGMLATVQRLVRVAEGGIVHCRQATNLYRIGEPRGGITKPVAPALAKAFPRSGGIARLALEALAKAESTQKGVTLIGVQPTMSYVAAALDWRARARLAIEKRLGNNENRSSPRA